LDFARVLGDVVGWWRRHRVGIRVLKSIPISARPLAAAPASYWPGVLSDLWIWEGWFLRARSTFDLAVEFVESVQELEEC
jgi:hypothetical protein